MPVPNTFANATTSIPLSQLDANFATAITLGNTAIQLGNTVSTLNNMTLANVTVSSGTVTVANVTVTGVGTFAAGSNTAPSITTAGDTNTGFFFPAADTVGVTTGGSERVRVDSSGNVGIGTSSPTYKLQVGNHNGYNDQFSVYNDGTFSTGGVNLFNYYNGTTNICGFKFASISSTTGAILMYTNAGSGVVERARIDSSGNFMVGTTSSTVAGKNAKVTAYASGSGPAITSYINTTSTGNQIIFANPNGEVGNINTGGTVTSYNTSSDYRLKHDVQPMAVGLSTVAALKPVTYKWNADNSDGEGFIAHELQAVIPQAVTGEKDAVDDEGRIKPQGVDYSKIVVHLVAAIQELSAKVAALEAKA